MQLFVAGVYLPFHKSGGPVQSAFLLAFLLLSALISKAADLEKFHCVPTQAPDNAKVMHYVFDTKSSRYKLYVTTGIKSAKISELPVLTLIDNSLDQTLVAKDADVQLRSAKNNMDFQLVITDNGGQTMRGTLIKRNVQVPIGCIDVELEK